MGALVNLTHHFLIAMPAMADPRFAHTLAFICEHNPDGAVGLVVNKPTDMTLSALYEQIDVPFGNPQRSDAQVLLGGPVQCDRGFVLHRPWATGNPRLPSAMTWDLPLRRTCWKLRRAAKVLKTWWFHWATRAGAPGSWSRSLPPMLGSRWRPTRM